MTKKNRGSLQIAELKVTRPDAEDMVRFYENSLMNAQKKMVKLKWDFYNMNMLAEPIS